MGPIAGFGLLLSLLLAAGCGSGTTVIGDTGVGTQLEVTVWPEGSGGDRLTASLTCDPEGGSHPDPVSACEAIEKHPDAFASVPVNIACTEIFGGPDEAEVKGSIGERTVLARLNRSNGCEIARWDALESLLDLDR